MKRTRRPCYVCGARDNPIIAEEPVEHRFGVPLMPEGWYWFARCRSCSTLYVDSDVNDDYLKGVYERETIENVRDVAGAPESHEAAMEARLPEFRQHWLDLTAVRPPRSGDRLLDIGCQTGEFGSLGLPDGVQPNGIDLSRSYAETCRALWGEGSIVHCGTALDAPFAPGSFSYVTSFETLEHMCDPLSTLRRMRELLTDDGVVMISVPSSDYFHFKFWLLRRAPFRLVVRRLLRRRASFSDEHALPHTHIYNFSRRSVARLLERAGLEVVATGLTGWHGGIRPIMSRMSRLLEVASAHRIGFAPSLFAVARPEARR